VRLVVAETHLDRHEERVTLSIGVSEWHDDRIRSSRTQIALC
jgi:hypothetical protein